MDIMGDNPPSLLDKLKYFIPGQVEREAVRALERVFGLPTKDVHRLLERVESILEFGALNHHVPKLRYTGTFLSSPFNTAHALTTEETAYAILQIELAHQQFLFDQGLRLDQPNLDAIRAIQTHIAELAIRKNEGAPFTDSKLRRQAIHNEDILAEALTPVLFGNSATRELNKLGIHYDSRNKTVGSTQIRLAQLENEISQGAKTYYHRILGIAGETSTKELELALSGKYTYEKSTNIKNDELSGFRGNDYKRIATMDQIVDYLHPKFRDDLETRELAGKFEAPSA